VGCKKNLKRYQWAQDVKLAHRYRNGDGIHLHSLVELALLEMVLQIFDI
jgi:hypothetical protein